MVVYFTCLVQGLETYDNSAIWGKIKYNNRANPLNQTNKQKQSHYNL